MTVDEAAAALQVPWRRVRVAMQALGWIVPVGGGEYRCTAGAIEAGLVEPVLERRRSIFNEITVEVGQRISRRGLNELQRAFAP